jgi:Transposase DDE domain
VVIDSTGIKVYGEGEWKVRQHGVSKRRTWRKLHLALDEGSGEILAAVASTNDWGDSEILPDQLEQIEGDIEQVSCDGAYDTSGCYDTITERGAEAVIPPRARMP